MNTLADKTALVTGGSRGIGAAIVRALAGEGASVAFTYSKLAERADALVNELTAMGAVAKGYRADAAEPQQLPTLLDEVLHDFGALHILVNNASKFAVAGLTRSWAKDLGPRGILVNAVQPGPIDTELNPADGQGADFMRGLTALGRYGRAEEIASVVTFLAGPGATYLTGATINVDGGWNA